MTGPQRSKPRYAELGDLLQAAIESGQYPVGTLLPTELELCERFHVSRHTARAALARLSSAGLVQRRPGAGTRVIAQSAMMRYEHEIDTVDLLLQYGNSTYLKVLDAARASADVAMAQLLDVREGKDYLQLNCLRLEPTRQAIAVTRILVPVRGGVPVQALLDPTTAARTITGFLAPSRLSRVEQIFDAASFSATEARLLGVKTNAPAMRVQRRYYDANEHLLLVAISLHPPERFAYSMVLTRNRRA